MFGNHIMVYVEDSIYIYSFFNYNHNVTPVSLSA